jgi:probable F420-dependent oxidoreductase
MHPREVGIVVPLHVEVPDFARRAEAAGFDLLGCGEHMFFTAPTYNTFIALSAAAAVTERIRLASTVCLLPLYPVAIVAKLSAELDRLSKGRFILGIGVGGESPAEFTACGVDVHTRGRRTDDMLPVLDALLSGREPAGGELARQFAGVRLNPVPANKPPIWVAGRQEAAMRRAALYGDGWVPYVYTAEQLGDSVATVRRFAQEAGRDWNGRVAVLVFAAVGRDGPATRRHATELMVSWYGKSFEKAANRYLVAGTPDECSAALKRYFTAGADTLFISPICEPQDAPAALELWGHEVLPALRGQ